MAYDVPDIIVAFPISLWVRCERAAMPPTVTVATVAILTTIELFIRLKAFCPKAIQHSIFRLRFNFIYA